MAETKIEWAATPMPDGTSLPGYTFNPWVGCTKVSPACDHCYAEGWAKRTGHPELWSGERRHTTAAYWKQPTKWNAEAGTAGVRRKVFCASLADVFDNQVPAEWRYDLWGLIEATPHLDWLLLTKRPQNARKMIIDARRSLLNSPTIAEEHVSWPWPNVWLGTTVENQEEADRRIPLLLAVPATVRFLSCEPLLGLLDLRKYLMGHEDTVIDLTREVAPGVSVCIGWTPPVDWVIAGGESGPKARPMHPDWARSIRDQCTGAGVPFFFKQWGEHLPNGLFGEVSAPDGMRYARVGKKAAGAMLDGREWRQMPEVK